MGAPDDREPLATQTIDFLKKKNLIMTLQEIDKNLYSNNKEIIKSNKLKDLKIEANNTSNKEVKRIENGK